MTVTVASNIMLWWTMVIPLMELLNGEPHGMITPGGFNCQAAELQGLLDFANCSLAITSLGPQARERSALAQDLRKDLAIFYRGQTLKVVLRLKFNPPIPEGTSLALFSPYAKRIRPGDSDDMSTVGLVRWLRRISARTQNSLGWGRKRHQEVQPLDYEQLARTMGQETAQVRATLASSAGGPPVESVQPTEAARVVSPDPVQPASTESLPMVFKPEGSSSFQYLRLEEFQGPALFEFDLDSSWLVPGRTWDPIIWLTLKSASGAWVKQGISLPQPCWDKMVFLRCRPAMLIVKVKPQTQDELVSDTIFFYRSDKRALRIAAKLETKLPDWLSVDNLSASSCQVVLDIKALRKASGDLPALTDQYIRFVDKASEEQLWTHLAVRVTQDNASLSVN